MGTGGGGDKEGTEDATGGGIDRASEGVAAERGSRCRSTYSIDHRRADRVSVSHFVSSLSTM